jgi:hypothetical protein
LLAQSAPTPEDLDEHDFRELQRSAGEYHRAAASLRFLELLSLGWRPHEVATGRLDGRAEAGMVDGVVQRETGRVTASGYAEMCDWESKMRAFTKSRQSPT